MHSIEATLSLFFLVLVSITALSIEGRNVDDSLYRIELANDVWRTLYLRHDFEDFSFHSNNQARDKAENDLKRITELTGMCVFISGERLSSCRGEESGKQIITTEKILVVDGIPQKVTLTLTHRLSS